MNELDSEDFKVVVLAEVVELKVLEVLDRENYKLVDILV